MNLIYEIMKTDPKEPISPMPHQNSDGSIQYNVYVGLTKREHMSIEFIKAIMSAGISNSNATNEAICLLGIQMADELIKQFNNEK